MGFLNIAGGIAAGAQRADELEASRLAKTTKGKSNINSFINTIIGTEYIPSDANKGGITIPSLYEMTESQLASVLSPALEYQSNIKKHAKLLERKVELQSKPEITLADIITNSKTNENSIFMIETPAGFFKSSGTKDNALTDENSYGLISNYRNKVDEYITARGGAKNISFKELKLLFQKTFGVIDTQAKLRPQWQTSVALETDAALLNFFPALKDLDPSAKKDLFPFIRDMSIFGGRSNTATQDIGVPVSKEEAIAPGNMLVAKEDLGESIATNTLPIISSTIPSNNNNPEVVDKVNKQGETKYGLKSVNTAIQEHINQKGSDKTASELATVLGNLTPAAADKYDGVNSYELLSYFFKKTRIRKKSSAYFRDGNSIIKIPQAGFTPDKKTVESETSIKTKMTRTLGSSRNALKQVTNITTLLSQQGVLRLISERPSDGYGENTDQRRLIKFMIDSVPREDGETTSLDNRQINNTDLYNAGVSLLQDYDKLSQEDKVLLQNYGSAYLADMPQGISGFAENVIANITGLSSLFTQSLTSKALDSTIKTISNSNEEGMSQVQSSLDKVNGGIFNSYIKLEREKHNSYLDTMSKNQRKGSSLIFLRAQAAARLSFSKIQLAYTYAAISQGGVGSARTISDTDFAKNLEALFSSQGAGLVAVMGDITQQIDGELKANEAIINFAGTGKMAEFTTVAKSFELANQNRKLLERQKLRGSSSALQKGLPITNVNTGNALSEVPIEQAIGSSFSETRRPTELYTFNVIEDNGRTSNQQGNFRFNIVDQSTNNENNFYKENIGNGIAGLPLFRKAMRQKLESMEIAPELYTKEGIQTTEGLRALQNAMFSGEILSKDKGSLFSLLEVSGNNIPLNKVDDDSKNVNLHNILVSAKEYSFKPLVERTQAESTAIIIAQKFISILAKNMAETDNLLKLKSNTQ